VPYTVTAEDGSTFRNFEKLESVTGANIETVGAYAFPGCPLTLVDLPEATSIGINVFIGCTALTDLYLPATPPALWWWMEVEWFQDTGLYAGTGTTLTIHVASPGTVAGYTSAWGVSADTAGAETSGELYLRNAGPAFGIPLLALFFPREDGARLVLFSPESLAGTFGAGANLSFLVNDRGDILIHPDDGLSLAGTNMAADPFVKTMRESAAENLQTTYIGEDGKEYLGAFDLRVLEGNVCYRPRWRAGSYGGNGPGFRHRQENSDCSWAPAGGPVPQPRRQSGAGGICPFRFRGSADRNRRNTELCPALGFGARF
jgi:hypothetical protein